MRWIVAAATIFSLLSTNSAWAGKCTIQVWIQKGWFLNRSFFFPIGKELPNTSLPACVQEMKTTYQSMIPKLMPESEIASNSFFETQGQVTKIEVHRIKDAPSEYKWSFSIYIDDSEIVPGLCFGAMPGVGQHNVRVGRDWPYISALTHTNPVYIRNTNLVDCTREVLTSWNKKSLRRTVGDSFRSSYVFKFDGVDDLYSMEVDMLSYIVPVPLSEWIAELGF